MANRINADSTKQYRWRENIRTRGILETDNEDRYTKLIDAVDQTGITIKREDISLKFSDISLISPEVSQP